ncbi:transcriptional regulator, partial [Enterococcus dongliensis]|nr:transcriptional regulator [Enterococcus dongliensis]
QLEEMIGDLSQGGPLAFSKDESEIDQETRELLIASLENSLRIAKIEAKKKFTPKKYRDE